MMNLTARYNPKIKHEVRKKHKTSLMLPLRSRLHVFLSVPLGSGPAAGENANLLQKQPIDPLMPFRILSALEA